MWGCQCKSERVLEGKSSLLRVKEVVRKGAPPKGAAGLGGASRIGGVPKAERLIALLTENSAALVKSQHDCRIARAQYPPHHTQNSEPAELGVLVFERLLKVAVI